MDVCCSCSSVCVMPERRWAVKRFLQAVGLASVLLATNYGDLLGGGTDVRMHVPYRLTGVVMAHIADIFILGAVLFGLAAALKPTRYYGWLRVLYLMLVPLWIGARMEPLYPAPMRDGLGTLLALGWMALLLLILLRFPLWYRQMVRAVDVVGIFMAMFAACSIAQMLYVVTWRPGTQEIRASWEGKTNPPREHKRVVWVLFDELSYAQVFAQRADDLELPNFDKLRAESTVYTNVQPIGMWTVKVLPSLLSGQVVQDYRYGFGNGLRVHDAGGHGFHTLDGSGTVFGDAQRAGWRTGVVGWYNPYCTIYKSALDSCYWTDLDRMDGNVAQQRRVMGNVARPLRDLVVQIMSPEVAERQECDLDVEQRYRTYRALEARASAMIAEDQADFVFLHLSAPHSPNIWSRINNDYVHKCGSSYLDNLALADRELGKIMDLVRSSPRWKDTTVIVQGDHSWRVQVWGGGAAWTDEDGQASHDNTFDPRPALILHDAGQTTAATDGRPLSLLEVHGALENAIAGRAAKIR
jgi:hypothetical protein